MPSYLPPSTQPWRIPIQRSHKPRAARGQSGYRSYRQCLRWEFGFSCAFCLLHEADLFAADIDGTGLTWIEHHVPKSHEEGGRNQYENCFYSCRFCNSAHGALPVTDAEGRRLLDPCRVAWRDFFELRGDELQPRDEGDAAYTYLTYDLDDLRKVTLRRKRRETLTEVYGYLSKGRDLHDRVLERARDDADPSLVDLAREMWGLFEQAAGQRERFAAIPAGAPSCPCGPSSLPETLSEQLR